MKKNKRKIFKKKVIILVSSMLVVGGTVFGLNVHKHHSKHKMHVKLHFEKLTKELNLTADQNIRVDKLKSELYGKMSSIRTNDLSIEENRKKKMEIMHEAMFYVKSILTESQLSQLQVLVEKFHDAHFRSTTELKNLRIKFDENLTAKEKEDIEVAKSMKKEVKRIFFNKEKTSNEESKEAMFKNRDEIMSLLNPIIESHENELNNILGNTDVNMTKPYHSEKMTKEMRVKRHTEMGHTGHGQRSHEMTEEMKKMLHDKMNEMKSYDHSNNMIHGIQSKKFYHFLLMEVESNVTNTPMFKVTTFPNPVSQNINVKYEVKKEGNVSINIQDKNGNIVKSINLGNKQFGEYTESIVVSELKANDMYMIVVRTAAGTVSNKIITKI